MELSAIIQAFKEAITGTLQPVETNFFFFDFATMKRWNEPFNQVTFFNWDPTNSVWINQHEVPANTYFSITLNTREVNQTSYDITAKGSSTAKLEIIYSQYRQIRS